MWQSRVPGGLSNKIMGGKFGDGFIAASVYAAFDRFADLPKTNNQYLETAKAFIIGGTAAELGGGKFANGGATAAFQYMSSEAFWFAGDKVRFREATTIQPGESGRNIYFGGSRVGTGHFWAAIQSEDGRIWKYDFAAGGYAGLPPGVLGKVYALLTTIFTKGKVTFDPVSETDWNYKKEHDEIYAVLVNQHYWKSTWDAMEHSGDSVPSYGVLDRNCGHRAMQVLGYQGTFHPLPSQQLNYVKKLIYQNN